MELAERRGEEIDGVRHTDNEIISLLIHVYRREERNIDDTASICPHCRPSTSANKSG